MLKDFSSYPLDLAEFETFMEEAIKTIDLEPGFRTRQIFAQFVTSSKESQIDVQKWKDFAYSALAHDNAAAVFTKLVIEEKARREAEEEAAQDEQRSEEAAEEVVQEAQG